MQTPILLADVTLRASASWLVPEVPERALFVHEGEVEIDGARVRAGQVAVLGLGATSARALEPARVLALGGTAVGPRFMWWNYLHSSRPDSESSSIRRRRRCQPSTTRFRPVPFAR